MCLQDLLGIHVLQTQASLYVKNPRKGYQIHLYMPACTYGWTEEQEGGGGGGGGAASRFAA